jgi:rare lipoprotein A (peptidoglycan hydrolase)
MVEISVGTRSITVPVIDRGPYRPGYDWDLTWEAARQLQMDGLATIGYLLQ